MNVPTVALKQRADKVRIRKWRQPYAQQRALLSFKYQELGKHHREDVRWFIQTCAHACADIRS